MTLYLLNCLVIVFRGSWCFSTGKWNEFDRNYKDDVGEFISFALDCAKNNVINAQNQEILIDSNGLKGQNIFLKQTHIHLKSMSQHQIRLRSQKTIGKLQKEAVGKPEMEF